MPGKKKKILLVEDDPMVIKMYKRKLLSEGFDLLLASNGEEGLEVLAENRPDLVLLDIMMPRMNGLEMLKTVRKDDSFKDIPIVMLTNLGNRYEDIEHSKGFGAYDHWIKANMSLDELVRKIMGILDNKRKKIKK